MISKAPRIGFIGFGEVAYLMAQGLKKAGLSDMVAYCGGPKHKPPYSEEFRQRAGMVGVELVAALEDLVKKSDYLFSLVTGGVSLQVAQQVAPLLDSRILYVDMNNSPSQAKEMAAVAVKARKARFVDVMIVGSPIASKHEVPLWASGDGAEEFRAAMSRYGMNIEIVSTKAGAASALKTIWQVLSKGIQALLWETILAARKVGVDLKAHPIPPQNSGDKSIDAQIEAANTIYEYLVWHSGIHAARKSGEMKAIAEELRRLGIEPIMTEAASKRLATVAEFNLKEKFGAETPLPDASRTMTEAIERSGGLERLSDK